MCLEPKRCMDKSWAHSKIHHDLNIERIIILLLLVYSVIPNGSYIEMTFFLEIPKIES
jgi:hypothetical protein